MSNLIHTIEYQDKERTKKYHEYWENSNEEYHRLNGPALISYYEDGDIISEHYYVNGESHRLDGPAKIWYYEDGRISAESYYINGEYYAKQNFEKHPKVVEYKKNKAFDETLVEILTKGE